MQGPEEFLQIHTQNQHFYPLAPYLSILFLLGCHSWLILCTTFLAWKPTTDVFNCTSHHEIKRDENSTNDHCFTYAANNSKQACENWDFEVERGLTMVADYDLVCQNDYFRNLMNTVFLIGVMIANILFGSLPDRIGRKPVALVSNWALGIVAFIMSITNGITSFLVLRLLAGIFYATSSFTIWTWASELFAAKNRYLPMAMMYHGWTIGIITLPLVAWLVPHWRHLNIVLGIVCMMTIPFYFIMPESLYWLIHNNYEEKASAIMTAIEEKKFLLGCTGKRKSQDVNLPKLGKFKTKMLEKEEDAGPINERWSNDKQTEKNIEMEIIIGVNTTALQSKKKTRFTFSRTYIQCLLLGSFYWFTGAMVYFGLSFSTSQFSGDRYVNFFLFGLVEIPATFLAYGLGKLTTRRFQLMLVHLICGIALGISGITRYSEVFAVGKDVDGNITNSDIGKDVFKILNLVGKLFITASFGILCYLPAEIYPTNVRSTSFNINASFSRIGAILGSFASLVFQKQPFLAEIVFGILGILAGVSAIWLPESKNQPLPQTMADLEEMMKKTKNICHFSQSRS